jgi:hypothetical protein
MLEAISSSNLPPLQMGGGGGWGMVEHSVADRLPNSHHQMTILPSFYHALIIYNQQETVKEAPDSNPGLLRLQFGVVFNH